MMTSTKPFRTDAAKKRALVLDENALTQIADWCDVCATDLACSSDRAQRSDARQFRNVSSPLRWMIQQIKDARA